MTNPTEAIKTIRDALEDCLAYIYGNCPKKLARDLVTGNAKEALAALNKLENSTVSRTLAAATSESAPALAAPEVAKLQERIDGLMQVNIDASNMIDRLQERVKALDK